MTPMFAAIQRGRFTHIIHDAGTQYNRKVPLMQ